MSLTHIRSQIILKIVLNKSECLIFVTWEIVNLYLIGYKLLQVGRYCILTWTNLGYKIKNSSYKYFKLCHKMPRKILNKVNYKNRKNINRKKRYLFFNQFSAQMTLCTKQLNNIKLMNLSTCLLRQAISPGWMIKSSFQINR